MLNQIAFAISDKKIKTSDLLSIKSILVIYIIDYYSLILIFLLSLEVNTYWLFYDLSWSRACVQETLLKDTILSLQVIS